MSEPIVIERRKSCRVEQNLEAYVVTPEGTRLSCVVRNVSSMGAYIDFRGSLPHCDRFKLVIPGHWFAASCEIRHRTGLGAGVHFTSNRREALARFASPFGTGESDRRSPPPARSQQQSPSPG